MIAITTHTIQLNYTMHTIQLNYTIQYQTAQYRTYSTTRPQQQHHHHHHHRLSVSITVNVIR